MNTYPVETLEISYSTLNAYASCPRKLEFAKLFGFNFYSRALASEGGTALHAALQTYLTTRDKQASILSLITNYPIDLCSNPLWAWSLEACYGALIAQIQFFDKNPQYELATVMGKPAIEVPFLINIKHSLPNLMPVVYRGYIDSIFYDRVEDVYFPFEFKNTAAKTTDFTPVYRWDDQCLPYSLVLNRALNLNIKTLESKYLISKVDLANPQIIQLEFIKSESEINEWAQDLYMKLANIATYISTQWFPRNAKGCNAFNRTCKYYDLCPSRKLSTLNLMLSSKPQAPPKPFDPWITLDLEIS